MTAFTHLETRKLSDKKSLLISDFSYVDKEFGTITVKKGFVTNFASLDALKNVLLFVLYAILVGYGDEAAVIHDWLYAGYGIPQEDGTTYYPSRKECDDVFYRALRAQGIARWRAAIFYIGVRLFGSSRYIEQKRAFGI